MSAFISSSIRSSSSAQLVGCNDLFISPIIHDTKHHLLSTQLSAMRITPKITPELVSTASTLTPSQLISSSSTIIITALLLRVLGLNDQLGKEVRL